MLVLELLKARAWQGSLGQSRQGRGTAEFAHKKNAFSRPGKLKMLVLELLKARAWQGSRGRAGRAGAQQSSKTTEKTLLQGLGSSKCWFWNCSKPGHGRAARAEQAGQGHSRVPKPPKKCFFEAWEAQNAGFGTAQSQGMAGQLGQSRQGRGTAEFAQQSSKATKTTLFQGLGSSKCWFWNCSKPGHGRAAGAEQAGQGHSRVPKPPKKRFFKAWEAQNAGFGTAQSQGMAGQLGQSRQGRGTAEFQNHQKNAFARPGKLKMLVLELLKARAWQGSWGRAGRAGAQQSSKTTKNTLFQGLGSSKCWFWNWAEQAGQGHSRVPKPPKKRFFKAWEAQNAGFGTAQSQGMAGQLGQSRQGRGTAEFQNHQKTRFFKAWEAQNAGFGTAQSQGMAGQLGQSRQGRGTAEFQNHQKKRFFKAWEAQNAGFGTAQSLMGFTYG